MSGPVTHIASEVIYIGNNNNIPYSYQTSLMDRSQANIFLQNRYEDKACVSLNQIFIPYATYDTSENNNSLASGNYSAISGHTYICSGQIETVYQQYDSDSIFPGNYQDKKIVEGEISPIRDNIRSVGINKDVYFVGTSTTSGTTKVAGPLDMSWDKDHWTAGGDAKIYIGFINSLNAATYTNSGIFAGTGTINDYGYSNFNMRKNIFNLDQNLAFLGGFRFCICVRLNSSDIKSQILNFKDNNTDDELIIPIYIGC